MLGSSVNMSKILRGTRAVSDDAIAARLASGKDAGHTRKLLLGAPPPELSLQSIFVDLEIKRLPLADHLAALLRGRPRREYFVVREPKDLYIPDVVPPEGAVACVPRRRAGVASMAWRS